MSSLAAFLLLDSDCLCHLITNLTSWHHNLLFASTCPCPSGCWRSFNQSMFDHDDMAIMVLEQQLHHCNISCYITVKISRCCRATNESVCNFYSSRSVHVLVASCYQDEDITRKENKHKQNKDTYHRDAKQNRRKHIQRRLVPMLFTTFVRSLLVLLLFVTLR